MRIANLFTLLALVISLVSLSSQKALAQSQNNEEKFQDLFTTAGYATAFGAALGAATLSFQKNPENHLRYVAIGASLGFIGGSILGAYTVFSPLLLADEQPLSGQNDPLAQLSYYHEKSRHSRTVLIQPMLSSQYGSIVGLNAAMTLLDF